MDINQQIISGINAELARQGKTRIDLSKPLGLSSNSIYLRFSGKKSFSTDELSSIATYLHMSLLELMRRCLQEKMPATGIAGKQD